MLCAFYMEKKCQSYISDFRSLTKCQQNSNLLLCPWFCLGWMGRSLKLKVAPSLLFLAMACVLEFHLPGDIFMAKVSSKCCLAVWKKMKRSVLQAWLWNTVRYLKIFSSTSDASNYKAMLAAWRSVCVFGAGYICCTKSVSKFVFKHTGPSSVFQLRQDAPVAWGATHELIGVKVEPYVCRFQIDAWSWSGLWGV